MPPDEKLLAAREWLEHAERDLRMAAKELSGPDQFPDDTVFHSEQAAEKALKAFLTARDQIFNKTHDLERLIQQCQIVDPTFSRFLHAAAILTPYAVRFRYPGGPIEPDVTEAQEAIRLANEIVVFVREKLFGGGQP